MICLFKKDLLCCPEVAALQLLKVDVQDVQNSMPSWNWCDPIRSDENRSVGKSL